MAPSVLILGGGLAGVACAHKLGDEGVPVTLVDRNDYHQFQPLLYQVASSQLPAEDIARPHRTIFKDYPTVTVVMAHVAAANLGERSLALSDGRTLTGSHVVMAAGARPNFFGVPGADQHAFPLYSVADAERLRRHLQQCCSRPRPLRSGPSRACSMWLWSAVVRPELRRLVR
ncbi:MAG TPA: FAD-dependent oxidoreductase [Propionibacteriaceae bacterium]|jgi:NADH dehydrogenase|nr:FAD-dependent oxidoreductase [Propionibacteriaceae bacterium]